MSKERESGYYWCKYDVEWEIAYWSGTRWECRNQEVSYDDTCWDEIDETPIKRNQP